MKETEVSIGIGSNSTDRMDQIEFALKFLSYLLSECKLSDIYETEALNGHDAPYLNAVAKGFVRTDRNKLNSLLKEWEHEAGRTPELKAQGIVPIDLDIVIWGDEIVRPNDFKRDYFRKGYESLS